MAAARPNQSPSIDLFDAYFRRADLDQDGKISGAEAVSFFQGSNLPKPVLAQIWAYADQKQTGFLGRPDFYNALRLVTVAQSGRELTADIVKAALYGPAAAKIPPPRINSVATPSSQMNSTASSTPPPNVMLQAPTQMGAMGPGAYQNPGIRPQQAVPPNMGMNQHVFPSTNNHLMRPTQSAQPPASLVMQGVGQVPPRGGSGAGPRFPGSNTPNLSTDWLSGRTSGAAAVPTSHPSLGVVPVQPGGPGLAPVGMPAGVVPHPQTSSALPSSVQPKPVDHVLQSSQPTDEDSRALTVSGNGFSSDSVFGGNMFSASSQTKQESSPPSLSASSSNSSSGSYNSLGQFNPLQSSLVASQSGSQLQSQLPVKQNQLDNVQNTLALSTSNVPVAPVTHASSGSQLPWPKITQSNIQKYTKVFVEVDKDKDGKITGEEARNLFLSWRLPREILKQVWDLSDQDNDSMLSLREFCIALYLMERYREGRPLPAVLPNNLGFDETFLPSTAQPSAVYGGLAWQRNPGLTHQGTPGSRTVMPPSSVRPHRTPLPSLPEETVLPQKQKAKVPQLEKHLVDQLSDEEQKAINLKFQEATDADKKVQELEKEILDSREKINYYRAKMQELVLYKSRCDNRLNEITERVVADKREVESLARKYEEKYKQSGDVASKLTLDEATFRDIQERKLELYNAIVKMEQGGNADGVLQDRMDRIQSDLEELVRALNERCKQYGLRAKPTSLVELPFGWQPGIQEEAADWDEDWDKFNDEGFAIIKELTVVVENIIAKPKPPTVKSDKNSTGEVAKVSSSSNNENKSEDGMREVTTGSSPANGENKNDAEKPSSNGEHAIEDESAHSEDGSARSPHVSPRRPIFDSPSPEFRSKQFEMHDLSPRAKDSYSDHAGAESTISGDEPFWGPKFDSKSTISGDEPSWGAKFDSSDDVDSVWGFSTINSKETDHDRGHHDSFFGPGDFGLNPIATGSPGAESTFGADKRSLFFDSVPGTPQYSSTFSPKFNEHTDDHSFDRFGQFDSFRLSDSGLFPQRDTFSQFDATHSTADGPSLARFDSMRSTADAPSFDSFSRMDSMRSTIDFPSYGGLSRFDSMRSTTADPPRGGHTRFDSIASTVDPPSFGHARFDSMASTVDYSGRDFPSFDDTDPFGSTGPFKSSSSDGHAPSRSGDNWSAF